MPIKQLKNDSITQRCVKCSAERDIRFSDMELGVEIDSEAGFKDIIAVLVSEIRHHVICLMRDKGLFDNEYDELMEQSPLLSAFY